MESEFRLQWGSQKSEPKNGIPNQAPSEDDCTHLGRHWVQPDGVVAHVKIKGCGISDTF